MKRKKSSLLIWALTLLVAGIAAIILIHMLKKADSSSLTVFRPRWLLLALLLATVQQLLVPLGSMLALGCVGQKSRYGPQLWISMAAISANSTVPVPAGMPIRVYLQKKILAISAGKSVAGLTIETLVSYGLACLSALLLGAWFIKLPATDSFSVFQAAGIGIFVIAIFLIAAGLLYRWTRQHPVGIGQAVRNTLRMVLSARPWPFAALLGVNLATYGLLVARFILVLYALDASAPTGALLAALIIAHLAGVLSFIPMGLGARELSLVSLLALLGVAATVAGTAVVIDRLLMTVPLLTGGVVATRVLGGYFRSTAE